MVSRVFALICKLIYGVPSVWLGIYNDDDFDDEDEDEEDLYPVQSEEVQRNTMMNDAPESDDYDLQLKLEQVTMNAVVCSIFWRFWNDA